jgi:hypothetical protein
MSISPDDIESGHRSLAADAVVSHPLTGLATPFQETSSLSLS